MAKFTEVPLEVLNKLTFLIDKETNKNLLFSCKVLNTIGYNISLVIKFIDEFMKPYETLEIIITDIINNNKSINSDNYFIHVNSFLNYLLKYRPCFQYGRKKYTLLYNTITLNNPRFFYFITSQISFYPTVIRYNALNIASKVGLVEAFDFFLCHNPNLKFYGDNRKDKQLHDKDYFRFFLNACKGGHIKIIEKLFSMERTSTDIHNDDPYRIKINKINTAGHSNIAFDTACEKGHINIVKLLLNRDEINNIKDWNNALEKSVTNNHLDVALTLINDINNKKRKDLLSKNTRNFAFRIASQKKNEQLTNALLFSDSLSISEINWKFAIKNAIINEHTELLYILLKYASKLKNKDKIISVNTNDLIMELIIKKSDIRLLQLVNEIRGIYSYPLNNENEIIELILKKNSCIIIENLFYFFISVLNNKPFNESKRLNLTSENWSKCVSLAVNEHHFSFLYYLMITYNPEYTTLLSVKSWNLILSTLLLYYKMNIFNKLYKIKSKDILLSSNTINLLIKLIIKENNEDNNYILISLTNKEISFISKENFNSVFLYSVEHNIELFIEKLFEYHYRNLITDECKELCLYHIVNTNNFKLFKILLLKDKYICSTKNRNYIYKHGSQEMKCFINSI
ncbi:hypothetical protein BCR32DRAFT_272435 [Anaeromyces robustus]|uniref:Uncharacterized protein n=1 Tax=Anaeromyces robustus TaxID=1754192 RepID=A0A1Y1W710_9FUNG|nr:hypothetical protein BCR32DRAFT_272435 [Anaeromyces robustus]|eukprot:ORX69340.1 hypothetical protein BCR32DRAFT_272435 [Anaeromyces robustus]